MRLPFCRFLASRSSTSSTEDAFKVFYAAMTMLQTHHAQNIPLCRIRWAAAAAASVVQEAACVTCAHSFVHLAFEHALKPPRYSL